MQVFRQNRCLRFSHGERAGKDRWRVTGAIESPSPVDTDKFRLLLRCERKVTTSNGKNSKAETDKLWHVEETVTLDSVFGGGGGTPSVSDSQFPRTAGLTEDAGNTQVEWRLTAAADVPGVDFIAEFLVPVLIALPAEPSAR